MPDGPVFSDLPVGASQAICPQKATNPGNWTTDCVLKFLCKRDRDVVAKIAKSNVDKADGIHMWNQEFDGQKWNKVRFDAAGFAISSRKYIMMLSNQSCEEAITTFYHETWHHYQDPNLGYPHDIEDDAYYHEELWAIERGLKGNPALHMRDENGKLVPDKAAIRRYVSESYGDSPDRAIARKADKEGVSWTQFESEATGNKYWQESKKGDTIFGDEIYSNKQTIPKNTWKCP